MTSCPARTCPGFAWKYWLLDCGYALQKRYRNDVRIIFRKTRFPMGVILLVFRGEINNY